MHQSLGYDKFYSKDSYTIDETIGLGLSDKSFFSQSVDIMKEIKTNTVPLVDGISDVLKVNSASELVPTPTCE